MKKFNKITALFVIWALILQFTLNISAVNNQQKQEIINSVEDSVSEYRDFLIANSGKNFSNKEIVLNFQDSQSVEKVKTVEEIVCNIIDDDNNEIVYNFIVEEAGLYNISVTYYDLLSSALSLKLGFYIDGISPYNELENVSLSKIYTNALDFIETDEVGNEIKPTQKAIQRFNKVWLESATGRYLEPYAIYLESGAHTLKVKKVLGNMLISEIKFSAHKKTLSYDEYLKNYSENSFEGKEQYIIQAENIFEISDSTIGPAINNTNAGMSPTSATRSLVNEFGGGYWTTNGQWGSWKVPDDISEGFYKLSFRVKQAGSVGVSSYRKLYINGEVPFEEAACIDFRYDTKWQVTTFGDEAPYMIYLKPGDIITLEATMGSMTEVISNIDNTLEKLNEIYQSIIIVTGTSPDTKRDYNLKTAIPGLLDNIAEASSNIDNIAKQISEIMGENNTKVFSLKRFSDTLKNYVSNYRIIVEELDDFKSLIDSFAAQTYDFNSSPLEIDWIMLSEIEGEIPKANVGFGKSLMFEIKRFLYSFSSDYSAISSPDKKTVTVWCSLGRDQAQSVKSIIDNDFVSQKGINIDFKITSIGLPSAVLSGKEPDVSLSVEQDVPINMALRGQALDLTPYINKCSDDSLSEINESAWIPFQYEGGTYAIPITQDFYMMFYRSDILSKLSVQLPDTWDELYKVIRELSKYNFSVGIKESDSASAGVSSAIQIFDMFLYQNGGTYFNDTLTATAFETTEAKNAFKNWVALYRDYSLPTDFNLITRFRSGEMPIIITGYSFYLSVSAIAQEIGGKWGMTLIPGTLMPDGAINRTETSTVTGVMVLKAAEERGVAQEAFEFAKWWATSDVQLKYSTAMESIQGIAGRQISANSVAFEKLNWTDSEKKIISSQREWVTAVNQVPGSYIINRSLSNALRSSYESTAVDPLRQLNIQNELINTELVRKRSEFVESN